MPELSLADAIGLDRSDVVALVGGGGKTTALRRLGSECAERGERVVLTSTTKIEPQGDLRTVFGPGMTRTRALEIVRQLAGALAAIHSHGIVHRDIKPENVMLRSDGSVALADFGIAKSMLQAESLGFTQTRHGDVVGTPFYMSPEQIGGKAVTARSDLYSLGVMLFEMLDGKRPFMAESLELLLAKHLHADTPALPVVHVDLQPIINRLMAKNPDARYASAEALLADLNQAA